MINKIYGMPQVPLFEFGASVSTSPDFGITKGEGILGLGQGKVSFPSQLGSHFGKKFSYCLVDILSDGAETSTMYFGDAAVPKGEVMYTPMLVNHAHPGYYYLQVTGISVGGSHLRINSSIFDIDSSGLGGTVIDSGTTITLLQPEAFYEVATVSSQFISALHMGVPA